MAPGDAVYVPLEHGTHAAEIETPMAKLYDPAGHEAMTTHALADDEPETLV